MVKVELSRVVNASQGKIFDVITDFEKLPSRFPNRYRSISIKERTGNIVTVEEHVTFGGRDIDQITRHALEPKRLVTSEVIDGDTKGTKVEITLEPEASNPNMTKVSINADLKLGKLGSVFGVFAKGKIKSALDHMIEDFEKAGP
jgi:ribosome-associated toxin RatA of RatAB toxin-antitoxin module